MSPAPCYTRVRSFIAVVHTHTVERRPRTQNTGLEPLHSAVGATGRVVLRYARDETGDSDTGFGAKNVVTLVIGDDSDWPGAAERCMGNAASVRVDLVEGAVSVRSSITGLPPIFLCRLPDKIVLTSEPRLLGERPESIPFDPAAVMDLFELGYAARNRTLLRDVSLVPGGHSVSIGSDGLVGCAQCWTLPAATTRPDWRQYVDFQVRTFHEVLRGMDLSRTFLSLTGGLDTRAILAALVNEGIRLPAATLSGPQPSLDARAAQALARAYGFPHYVVRLGLDFLKELPRYVVAAARLSGGGTSLEEAGEVYFYQQLGDIGARRLSGHLGNQVARQGVERTSRRSADTSVLSGDVLRGAARDTRSRALLRGDERWHAAYERLLREEATHSVVGNFRIGHHFATQLSPYAHRAMIESLGCSPVGAEPADRFTPARVRLRDLRHRFLGEPRPRSFQRALIARVGGQVAQHPINWGWLAAGGVSFNGLAMGTLACADVVAAWPNSLSRGLRSLLHATGVEGMHEIKPYHVWLTEWLRDFVHDTLLSGRTRHSGVFDVRALERTLRDHYARGRSRYATIVAALDLALAHQVLHTE
jgi:hypothetical protein